MEAIRPEGYTYLLESYIGNGWFRGEYGMPRGGVVVLYTHASWGAK